MTRARPIGHALAGALLALPLGLVGCPEPVSGPGTTQDATADVVGGADGSADVPTAAIANFLVTHEGVPADLIYQMTKAMYDNLDMMVAAHAAAKAIKRENALKGMPLPLHPGAEKYYREVGLLK